MEKHIIQKFSRLLPSSLSSCHFKNVHPDVVQNSILLPSKTSHKLHSSDHHKSKNQPNSIKSKSKSKRHTKPTKLSSSSNNSGWFSTDEDEEEEELEAQNKEVVVEIDHHPETETMYSLSSSFSSCSDGFQNSICNPRKGEVLGRSFNSAMGNSPAIISGEFSRKNVQTSSRRMSSASSCNFYYSDLGSFRREIVETRWRNDDNVKGTLKSHHQATKSPLENEQSSDVPSTSSNDILPIHRETRKVNRKTRKVNRKTSKSRERCTMKLIDGEGSSIKSTQVYYSDLGSFRRETANARRKTRRKSTTKKLMRCRKVEESYAVEKSSSDPYSDFKLSMVEMIVEKEIYGEEELEKLLEKFLSLNSYYHHDVIVKVFLDVCKILFS